MKKQYILILNNTLIEFIAVRNDYGFIKTFHSYDEAKEDGLKLLTSQSYKSFKVYEEVEAFYN